MTLTQPLPVGLSVLMRAGSETQHRHAEASPFVAALVAGEVSEAGYARYLALYRRVYLALESVGRTLSANPVARRVIDPALHRGAAISADLAFWSSGAVVTDASPAVDEYVARIHRTLDDPKRCVAHHYTRYLGDLSGGQAIGRRLTRNFRLPIGAGVAFYTFPDIAKPKLYKDAYRARLDALPLNEASRTWWSRRCGWHSSSTARCSTS